MILCGMAWCGILLCCAILCCAILCCAMLCCAMLCCAMLCYAVLCCAMLCYAVLCSIGLSIKSQVRTAVCAVLAAALLSLSDACRCAQQLFVPPSETKIYGFWCMLSCLIWCDVWYLSICPSPTRAAAPSSFSCRPLGMRRKPFWDVVVFPLMVRSQSTPSPPTKRLEFRGFDSSRLLILRGENSHVRRSW